MICEGEVYRVSSLIAVSPEHDASVRKRSFVANPNGTIAERAAFECRIIHIHDITALPDYPASAFIRTGTVLGVLYCAMATR